MSLRLCLLVRCLWLAVLVGPGAVQAARHALIIGNDSYQQVAMLRNARADAQAMAQALGTAGYRVELRTDRTLKQMQADLRDFRLRIAEGDEIVLFFSGHGVQLGGTNYLLPVDVAAQNEEQVKDDAMALSKALDDLRERKPRFTLAIIDACRDNPFVGTGRAIGGRGLTGVAGASGQMVIYAAGEGQRALDRLSQADPVRNGLFTRVFLREIERPGVPIRDVLFRVRDEVASLAESVKHEQVPAVYDQVRGTFYFHPPAPGTAVPAVATAVAPSVTPAAQVPPALVPGQVFKDCDDCPQMVVVPAGQFLMGSPPRERDRNSNEGPQRRISVPSFAMARYEVTRGLWTRVMGSAPRYGKDTCPDDECPAVAVFWSQAREFAARLSRITGQVYRLPSEAEWEYAARAGTTTAYPWGEKIGREYANYGKDTCCGGHAAGPDRWVDMAPVGQFPPNAFGLYDMNGNAWEWAQDCFSHTAYSKPAPPLAGAYEESACKSRVLRGGSQNDLPENIRSAARYFYEETSSHTHIGFRLVRVIR